MINTARYIENETGTEVLVEDFHPWEPHERYVAVRYPSGRSYALPWATLWKHFTIVSPQEVFVTAFGGIDDRPTAKQRELGAAPSQPIEPVPASSPSPEPQYVSFREE